MEVFNEAKIFVSKQQYTYWSFNAFLSRLKKKKKKSVRPSDCLSCHENKKNWPKEINRGYD